MLLIFSGSAGGGAGGPAGGPVSTIRILIAGADKTTRATLNRMSIDMTLGSDWTASVVIHDTVSTAAAYRPTLDQEITISDGVTTLFHGTITRVEDAPIVGPHIGTQTTLTARAKSQVVDQIVVDATYAAGSTRKSVVQDLHTNYLAAYGITIDATMTTGATLEAQAYANVTMREVLNHIADVTGDVWRITPNDELQFFAAGAKVATYSLTAANRQSYGPVTWEKTRERYVNSVVLRYGTETQVPKTQTIVGTGTAQEFALDYASARNETGYILSAGYVTDNGVYSPLSDYGGTTDWQFVESDNAIYKSSGPLGLGLIATFTYNAQFPQKVTVEDAAEIAANGRYSAIFEAPDIFDKDAAQELADGLLRKALAVPMWVRLKTRQGFVMPGDQITLTFTDRLVSGAHLITQVHLTTIGIGLSTYDLTCLSGGEAQQTWKDQLKAAISSGGANAPGGTISGSVVPNSSGNFDGDVASHAGGTITNDFEARLGTYQNSGMSGPALMLGRSDQDYRWAIVGDTLFGSTPGSLGSLNFHLTRRGSAISAAMRLCEDGSDHYVMLPGEGLAAVGGLYLGDFSGLIPGAYPDYAIKGILTEDIRAINGIYEYGRSTRAGEWIQVPYSASNFNASSGSWNVDSGDIFSYQYMLLGKTMALLTVLDTTSITATPGNLFLTIPGGNTAARYFQYPCTLFDNSISSGTPGYAQTDVGSAVITIGRLDLAAFSTAVNFTYVRLAAVLEIQ